MIDQPAPAYKAGTGCISLSIDAVNAAPIWTHEITTLNPFF